MLLSPELGVTSQGETLEKAKANIKEAIELHIESFVEDIPCEMSLPFGPQSKLPLPKLPVISGKEPALKKAGFVKVRQKGSQYCFKRSLQK